VIVALIFGSLHELLVIAGLYFILLAIAAKGTDTSTIAQLCVQVLFAAALGRLILYLIRILREPAAA
jgi:hypothetical protein